MDIDLTILFSYQTRFGIMERIVFCFGFLLLGHGLFSCKEVYNPEVDSMDNVMIVDGIITDQPGRNVIKLNYYQNHGEYPLSDATVYVTDDAENVFLFSDNDPQGPGHYYPSESFAGIPGRIYTLHVETIDGERYESEPQSLLPVASIEDVRGQYSVREHVHRSYYGRYYRQEVPGIEVLVDFSTKEEDILRFRIEPTLLLLYTRDETEEEDEEFEEDEPIEAQIFYGWEKFSLTDEANLNIHIFDEGFSDVKDHVMCFLPFSKYLYNLKWDEVIHKKILIIRYYTLNSDAHRFYGEAYKQVISEDKLFAPVVSQLPTNIRNISNPNKPVAGFFEASSTQSETYVLFEMPERDILTFNRTWDLEYLPDNGEYLNEIPYFW